MNSSLPLLLSCSILRTDAIRALCCSSLFSLFSSPHSSSYRHLVCSGSFVSHHKMTQERENIPSNIKLEESRLSLSFFSNKVNWNQATNSRESRLKSLSGSSFPPQVHPSDHACSTAARSPDWRRGTLPQEDALDSVGLCRPQSL